MITRPADYVARTFVRVSLLEYGHLETRTNVRATQAEDKPPLPNLELAGTGEFPDETLFVVREIRNSWGWSFY